jgi:hypothetical protein
VRLGRSKAEVSAKKAPKGAFFVVCAQTRYQAILGPHERPATRRRLSVLDQSSTVAHEVKAEMRIRWQVRMLGPHEGPKKTGPLAKRRSIKVSEHDSLNEAYFTQLRLELANPGREFVTRQVKRVV